MPSRDPSADRVRQAARDSSAGRGRPLQGDPRERAAAARSTERLRGAVHTTPGPAFPPWDQRAASPGRALHEVRQRLQQYTSTQAARQGLVPASPGGQRAQAQDGGWPAAAAAAQRARVPPTGDHYADASAEIADIDNRLQSLQNFLRSAKAGQPVAVPA